MLQAPRRPGLQVPPKWTSPNGAALTQGRTTRSSVLVGCGHPFRVQLYVMIASRRVSRCLLRSRRCTLGSFTAVPWGLCSLEELARPRFPNPILRLAAQPALALPRQLQIRPHASHPRPWPVHSRPSVDLPNPLQRLEPLKTVCQLVDNRKARVKSRAEAFATLARALRAGALPLQASHRFSVLSGRRRAMSLGGTSAGKAVGALCWGSVRKTLRTSFCGDHVGSRRPECRDGTSRDEKEAGYTTVQGETSPAAGTLARRRKCDGRCDAQAHAE